jgi:Tol biopolymer transport system component
MNKKAIAILGAIFILIVATLGFLIYARSHKTNTATTPPPADQTNVPAPPDNTPPAPEPEAKAAAVKLTDDEVISPVLFFQGNGITYFNSQGQLFQTDLQVSGDNVLLSNKRELTIALKSGIEKILWPPSGNNFLARISVGSSSTLSFYDGNKGTYVDLPSQIESVDWLPSSDKVMMVYVDSTGKATLNTASPDGSNYETVTQMYEADDQISVSPDGKSILFWRTQNRDATNIISFLSPDGKVYKAVVNNGYNLGVKWSPDSQKFVFGKRDPQTQVYQLWMADLSSGVIKSLGVNTIPDKMAWAKDGSTVYAAVPTQGTPGNGLTTDTIMKITVSTGDKQEFPPGTTVDGGNLFLNLSGDKLFFKNNQDRSLYYIDVSK